MTSRSDSSRPWTRTGRGFAYGLAGQAWGSPADRGGPDLVDHAEGLAGQTGAQVDQGDQQPVGEHQLVFWPSAGLAPPVAAPPLAAPGLASRLPPRREFGDKLAKVFP